VPTSETRHPKTNNLNHAAFPKGLLTASSAIRIDLLLCRVCTLYPHDMNFPLVVSVDTIHCTHWVYIGCYDKAITPFNPNPCSSQLILFPPTKYPIGGPTSPEDINRCVGKLWSHAYSHGSPFGYTHLVDYPHIHTKLPRSKGRIIRVNKLELSSIPTYVVVLIP
jgi:hypothetical protein